MGSRTHAIPVVKADGSPAMDVADQINPTEGHEPAGVVSAITTAAGLEEDTEVLQVKKLTPAAELPQKATPEAAGYDLCSAVQAALPPNGKLTIPTDLAMAFPVGTYGRIAPRSGLAAKKHIAVGAGVIDPDYRGNVHVLLFNHGTEEIHINKGDRIAQLVVERIASPEVIEVQDLAQTLRNEKGFGSTGVQAMATMHVAEQVPPGTSSLEEQVLSDRERLSLASASPERKMGKRKTLAARRDVQEFIKDMDPATCGPPCMSTPVPPEILKLNEEYKDLFPTELPPGLPPSRPTDHRINFRSEERRVGKEC